MNRIPLLWIVACVACASRPRVPARAPPDDGRFVIRIARGVPTPCYDAGCLHERIERTPSERFSITVRADAVARFVTTGYPATCVRLELTDDGAARLRHDAGTGARPAGRDAPRLQRDLDAGVFVVEFDGRRLFEGQLAFVMNAAAFDTPAMYPNDEPAPGDLLVVPSHGMWTTLGPGGRSPIDHAALRAYFRARNTYAETRRCARE